MSFVRTDFKVVLRMIGLSITSKEKRILRKRMDPSNSKFIQFVDFQSFFNIGTGPTSAPGPASNESESGAASIPVDTPSLPDNYSHRPNVEKQLIDLLVGKASCQGGCIAAYGMGGSGKTCITAAVVREKAVLKKFSKVAWLGLSQAPQIQNLQHRYRIGLFLIQTHSIIHIFAQGCIFNSFKSTCRKTKKGVQKNSINIFRVFARTRQSAFASMTAGTATTTSI